MTLDASFFFPFRPLSHTANGVAMSETCDHVTCGDITTIPSQISPSQNFENSKTLNNSGNVYNAVYMPLTARSAPTPPRKTATFADAAKSALLTRRVTTFNSGTSQPSEAMSVVRSYSLNSVIVDFKALPEFTYDQAMESILANFDGIEGCKAQFHQKLIEVAFISDSKAAEAMDKGLYLKGRSIPLSRCFHPEQLILPVHIEGLPFYPKEDTVQAFHKVFAPYGKVKVSQFHYFGASNVRMDSATVVLELDSTIGTTQAIPRSLEIFGKAVTLFWKNAPLFCKYCKKEGEHTVHKCPSLEKKVKVSTTDKLQANTTNPIVSKQIMQENQTNKKKKTKGPLVSSLKQLLTPTVYPTQHTSTATLPTPIPNMEGNMAFTEVKHTRSCSKRLQLLQQRKKSLAWSVH